MARINWGKVAGGHVFGVNDVFDGYADAVQGSALVCRDGIERAGGCEDEIRVKVCPGVHYGVACGDVSDQRSSTVCQLMRASPPEVAVCGKLPVE